MISTSSCPQPLLPHVVWDWNGTLKDDLDDIVGATNAAVSALGEPPVDRDAYLAQHCVPLTDFYARLLGRPLAGGEWALAEAAFVRSLAQRPVRLRDGARDLLVSLQERGYTQSLLSLLPHDRLLAETAEAGIDHVFLRIEGRHRDDAARGKRLRTHLRALGRTASEVLVIGDSRADARAAREIGAPVVLVAGGLEPILALHEDGAPVAMDLDEAVEQGLRRGVPTARNACRSRTVPAAGSPTGRLRLRRSQ
ncbi:HAD family hydrolase [Streptomyces sp. NPDC001255]|uniref:HAD family hydrolase n=1 Tax=Streptomyces sp. NPDC001255 TaxID=3364550 RepID=UPI00368CC1C1